MLSWFDIAYLVLNVFILSYCLKSYFLSKKKPFLLTALGFVFLTVSDFLWAFSFIPMLNEALSFYGYIRLGLYTVFILLILRAIQLFNSKPETPTK